MDNKNIVFNHTLEQYNKKYRNRQYRLLKVTKKEVEEFDKINPTKAKGYLLKDRKWWFIGDTYYEVPKPSRLSWFRNLNTAVQIGVGVFVLGVVVNSVAVPLILLNRKTEDTPRIPDPEVIISDEIEIPDFELNNDNFIAHLQAKDSSKKVKLEEVKRGETILVKEDQYLYDDDKQELTIVRQKVKNLTGNIYIKATATKEEGYKIEWATNKVEGEPTLYELATQSKSIKFIKDNSTNGTLCGETNDDKIFYTFTGEEENKELKIWSSKPIIFEDNDRLCWVPGEPDQGTCGVFESCSNATDIVLDNIDTSLMQNMYCMFFGCESIKELDLSKFDTSNVTTMVEMFSGCKALEKINLQSFNTFKVENMASMFFNCLSIKELDLSTFDTSNVSGMGFMFSIVDDEETNNLEKIVVDKNKFNVNKVMTGEECDAGYSMFSKCNKLKGENGTTLQKVIDTYPEGEEKESEPYSAIYARVDEGASNLGYLTQKK